MTQIADTRETGGRGAGPERLPSTAEGIVDRVRERYGRIAERPGSGCCGPAAGCGTDVATPEVSGQIGYGADELAAVPEGANLGLGCGAPVAHLRLERGEVVLDLGSGGGLDAFLAARQVGPEGKVIGVDMTPEMIQLATRNAERAGLPQVEFRLGRLEALPVADGSVDAVTSNCVVNLVPDKGRVFREIARVLRPGGRLVIADILLDGQLPEAISGDLLAYVGCVAGAVEREEYFAQVAAAGLTGVEVLKDVDALGALAAAVPEEAWELLRRTGVEAAEIEGKVRSVTFRAVKA